MQNALEHTTADIEMACTVGITNYANKIDSAISIHILENVNLTVYGFKEQYALMLSAKCWG